MIENRPGFESMCGHLQLNWVYPDSFQVVRIPARQTIDARFGDSNDYGKGIDQAVLRLKVTADLHIHEEKDSNESMADLRTVLRRYPRRHDQRVEPILPRCHPRRIMLFCRLD